MTTNGKEVQLSLKAELLYDRSQSRGQLHFYVGSTVKISDENGEELGWICAPVDGGIDIMKDGRLWHISPQELWQAVSEATKNNEKEAKKNDD